VSLRRRGYLLAGLAACFWALGALVAKGLFGRFAFTLEPAQLSAARAGTSFIAIALLLVAWRRSAFRLPLRALPFMVVFGVAGQALLHLTYYMAIAHAGVATAILLQYLAPVLVMIVSVLFLGERFTLVLPAAVSLAVVGCALMVGAVGSRGLTVSNTGIAWGLVSAAFFSCYILMGKVAAGRYSSWTLLVYGLGAASLFWLVYFRGFSALAAAYSAPVGAVAVLFISLVGTLLPFGLFLKALEYIEATEAGITATLEPVVAGVGAFLLLGEALTVVQLVGAALVIAAIVLVQTTTLRDGMLPPGD